MAYPKTTWDRGSAQGGQQALVDLMLLLSLCLLSLCLVFGSLSKMDFASVPWHSACCTGVVVAYPKTAWDRGSVQGGQQALVDLTLLASCPVLLGTFYSSYSEAARLLGQSLFIQVRKPCKHSGLA